MASSPERLCKTCAAFIRVRTDERLGRVGECALEVFRPPVLESFTCTRYREKGALGAEARPRAAGEPRKNVRSTVITRSSSSSASSSSSSSSYSSGGSASSSSAASHSLPQEIDIDMDIDDFRRVLREVLEDELGLQTNAEMVPRWQGGELVLKPGKEGTQEKRIPIETFFKKIVSVRDKLRLLEAKVNAHSGLSEEDKVILTTYVTGAYGSLTSFNLLFQNKQDQFVGQSGSSGKDE